MLEKFTCKQQEKTVTSECGFSYTSLPSDSCSVTDAQNILDKGKLKVTASPPSESSGDLDAEELRALKQEGNSNSHKS